MEPIVTQERAFNTQLDVTGIVPDITNVQILVAEDNKINQLVIARMLRCFDIACDIVSDGAEAVTHAKEKQYPLILMDCLMPTKDGFTATKEIRESTINSRTPIVALTALVVPGDYEKCIAAGMTDYLTKPFTKQQIKTLLTKYLPHLQLIAHQDGM